MTLLEALAGAVIKQEEPYLARMPLFLSWYPKDLPLATARSYRPAIDRNLTPVALASISIGNHWAC